MAQNAAQKADNAPASAGKRIGKTGLIDVSKAEEIKQLGYTVETGENSFTALEIDGEDVIGPATTIAALHTLVKQAVGNRFPLPKEDPAPAKDSNLEELAADSKGRTWLPGSGPIVDKAIAAAAQVYEEIKMERVKLSNREKVAKDDLIAQVHLKPELFTTDPNDSNSKVYVVSDIEIRIKNEIVEKISTKRIGSDD
jgi:hypothetical protein